MQTFFKAVSSLLLLTILTVPASSQSVVQTNAINITAIVKVGGPPVSVTQTGNYNYAGVVQTGSNPSATIKQNGQAVNAGFISQSGTNTAASITQSGGPRVNNGAAIGQSPWGYRR